MIPRRYSFAWRVAAGLLSLATLAALGAIVRGEAHHPLGWAEAAGATLVLLVLPSVALTGRAPTWFERLMRRDV